MAEPLMDATLDAILATQLTVAWAGEGRSHPRRLGWWDTDLVDPNGGGDLFSRLLPQTAAWASLEAVREAARRVDARARGAMAAPDKLRSIFFLGFELDEQLSDRLAALKVGGKAPADALRLPIALGATFDRQAVSDALGGRSAATFAVVPGGRLLAGAPPAAPNALVAQLAAALVPLAEQYPLPFYALGG